MIERRAPSRAGRRTVCPNFFALSHAERLAPERVTLGCLRADRGLVKKGNGVFAALDPLEEPDGLAWHPFADRIRMYRGALDALANRVPVGLCEETEEAWTAVGLDPESNACNCAT